MPSLGIQTAGSFLLVSGTRVSRCGLNWSRNYPRSGAEHGERYQVILSYEGGARYATGMHTEMGEYIVGAYLQLIENCDVVQYNQRLPGGKLTGLDEVDVVGINLKEKKAILCEVATHICGLQYGSGNTETIQRIQRKLAAQNRYAAERLSGFTVKRMFWSPNVPIGRLTDQLRGIDGVEIRINGSYKNVVDQLMAIAGSITHDTGNPFIRMMQIILRLRAD